MARQYTQKIGDVKFYYKDPEKTILHRVDGPAKEWDDGSSVWYRNGFHHRVDGPAVDMDDVYKKWWVNGIFIFAIDEEGNIVSRMK